MRSNRYNIMSDLRAFIRIEFQANRSVELSKIKEHISMICMVRIIDDKTFNFILKKLYDDIYREYNPPSGAKL
jgi:hypothetical protein